MNGFAGGAVKQLPGRFVGGFARMSHSAMSMAPMALMTAPVGRSCSCRRRVFAKAFGIKRIFADEHFPTLGPAEWVLGASMQARAIHGLTSLSPMPVMPSSVWTNTTMSSCAERWRRCGRRGRANVALDVGNLHLAGHG